MEPSVYETALLVVLWGSYLRFAAVVLASVRTFRNRRSFVSFRLGWRELLVVPEPFLLAGATVLLHLRQAATAPFSSAGAAGAIAGATLVLVAWGVTIGSFLSWRSVFTGHGVLSDHQLVTRGAYGLVRHPIYLGVFLMWLGLAVAFASVAVLLVTLLYVVPSYLLYMHAEEEMMMGAFGDAYREYRRTVPMLIPWLHARRPPASTDLTLGVR